MAVRPVSYGHFLYSLLGIMCFISLPREQPVGIVFDRKTLVAPDPPIQGVKPRRVRED